MPDVIPPSESPNLHANLDAQISMTTTAATPQHTLAFAKRVLTITQNRRAAQLAAKEITQAQYDADVLAAADLVRLAEDELIFGGPALN